MLVQNIFSKSTYLCSIKNDDKMIQTEGVESLSEEELRQACRERGHLGLLSTEEMRQQVCCIMICTWSHVVWSRMNFFFSCPFIFLIPLCWPFLLQLFESSILVLQYSHSSFWDIFNTLTLLVSLILTFQASQPRINLGLLTQSHLRIGMTLEWSIYLCRSWFRFIKEHNFLVLDPYSLLSAMFTSLTSYFLLLLSFLLFYLLVAMLTPKNNL